ncbi:MAG TPA: FTR1 family protein [Conexibacter sp.]|nr:FTR1 family protein [Conexibacter sp.]
MPRIRSFIPLLLAVALTALALPGVAGAKQNDLQRGRSENAIARSFVDRALGVAKAGDYAGAYELARSGYLDHYEYVEIPLRLRDPNLVLDTEFKFADLRNDLKSRAPIDTIRADVRDVRAGILATDRKLAAHGVAAPALAFGFSFSILFREGIEAVLLIAILLGSLAAGQASNYKRPLSFGVLAAFAATAITWVLATVVLDVAPVNRELLEAATALLAVLVLVVVSFWLVARIEQRRRMEFMRARVATAIAAGSATAFMMLGFTAVYREGFETVLFYQALLLFADGLGLWVALGAAAAAVALGAVAYAILRLGRTLPLKPMLVTGASLLLLLSVAFSGNAVRSLQEADIVSATPVHAAWARPPVFVSELTGIHPTRESLLVQAVLLVIFAAGAAWVFAWAPARRRRRERLAAVASAPVASPPQDPAREGSQPPVEAGVS